MPRDIKSLLKIEKYLKSQFKSPGEVAILEANDHYVFYLVNKKLSNQKPDLHNISKCLLNLRKIVKLLGVKHLAIPRLSCGRDGYNWTVIKPLIISIFQDLDFTITSYFDWKSTRPQQPSISAVPSTPSIDGGHRHTGVYASASYLHHLHAATCDHGAARWNLKQLRPGGDAYSGTG